MTGAQPAGGLREACLARLQAGWVARPGEPGETPESTLAALWQAAAGRSASAELAMTLPAPRLDAVGALRLKALIDARLAGRPLRDLTGRQRFMGLEMLGGANAPVIRRDTELLARRAFALLARRDRGAGAPLVLDIGVGHVAAALAALVPSARLHAGVASDAAAAFACDNLVHLHLDDRVQVRRSVGLAAFAAFDFAGRVDLIVGGKPQGEAAERLFADAPSLLKPGGWLAIEVDAGQGTALRKQLLAQGRWSEVSTEADEHGALRVLSAQRA